MSLDAQIHELAREIASREKHYPRFVVEGRLDASAAERRIAALKNALKNLRALRTLDEERRRK